MRKCFASVQVMDFGYPQFTEAKILSEFIKTDAHKMEVGDPALLASLAKHGSSIWMFSQLHLGLRALSPEQGPPVEHAVTIKDVPLKLFDEAGVPMGR